MVNLIIVVFITIDTIITINITVITIDNTVPSVEGGGGEEEGVDVDAFAINCQYHSIVAKIFKPFRIIHFEIILQKS